MRVVEQIARILQHARRDQHAQVPGNFPQTMYQLAVHRLRHPPSPSQRFFQPRDMVAFRVIGEKSRAAEFRKQHQLRSARCRLLAAGTHRREVSGKISRVGWHSYGRDGDGFLHGSSREAPAFATPLCI
jgi:hypothetical protein